jgi:hypothetical protein
VTVDSDTAHVVVAGGNAHRKTVTNGFQYFHRLVHHFRANAITRQTAIW